MGFLEALGKFGNALDIPGSMLRDALMLENPFDQWATPLTSENRVTGREMLRESPLTGWAVDDEDTVANFLAGLILEMAADPLNLIGGSLLGRSAKAGKRARELNVVSREQRAAGWMPEEIAAQTLARTDEGPLTMLHGTSGDFLHPDPQQWTGRSLYGPGHYMTESESAIPAEQLIARVMHEDDALKELWQAGDPIWPDQARDAYLDLVENIDPMRPVGDPLIEKPWAFEAGHSTKPAFHKGRPMDIDDIHFERPPDVSWVHPEVRVKDLTLKDVMVGKTNPEIQDHIRTVLRDLPPKEKEAALELFNLETRHPAYKPEAIRSAEVAEGYGGGTKKFSLTDIGWNAQSLVEPEEMLARVKSFLTDYDTYMEGRPYQDWVLEETFLPGLTARGSRIWGSGLETGAIAPGRGKLANTVKKFDDMHFVEWHREASVHINDMQRDYKRIHKELAKRDINLPEEDPALWGMHKKHFELIVKPDVLSRHADIRNPFELNKVWSRPEVEELSDKVGRWFEIELGGDSEVIDSLIDRVGMNAGAKRATGGDVLSALHEHVREMDKFLELTPATMGGNRQKIYFGGGPATHALLRTMEKRLGLATRTGAKTAVNELLSEMGYDAIKHIGGGRVTGPGELHNVWIALNPKSVYRPHIAPLLQSESRISPLGASLLGLGLGGRGAKQFSSEEDYEDTLY